MKENGQCCLLLLPERPDLAGHHWTCYVFSAIEKSRVSKCECCKYSSSLVGPWMIKP